MFPFNKVLIRQCLAVKPNLDCIPHTPGNWPFYKQLQTEIAEEELQNNLWISQEERVEIGAERSDMDKDIHPTPPKATEPSTSQGPRSLLLVNRHLLHGHSWCLWASYSHLRTIAKGPGERNEGCTLRSSCPW